MQQSTPVTVIWTMSIATVLSRHRPPYPWSAFRTSCFPFHSVLSEVTRLKEQMAERRSELRLAGGAEEGDKRLQERRRTPYPPPQSSAILIRKLLRKVCGSCFLAFLSGWCLCPAAAS